MSSPSSRRDPMTGHQCSSSSSSSCCSWLSCFYSQVENQGAAPPRPKSTVGEEEIDNAVSTASGSADDAVKLVAQGLRAVEVLNVCRRLNLARIVVLAVRAAQDSQTLQEIVVKGCWIGEAGARALAEGLPVGLQTLELDDNEIGDAGVVALAGQLPRGLKTLSLADNGITRAGVEALAKGLPSRLESLNLGGNSIGTEGVRMLASEDRLAWLLRLDLYGAGLGDEGTCALAEVMPAKLLALDLGGNEIGMTGASALATGLPAGLRSLLLFGNGLTDDGVRVLAGALPVELQELNLEDNRIGANGVYDLARALHVGLQTLDLSRNQIGDEGAAALAGGLPRGLQTLSLQRIGITDVGATALARRLPRELMTLGLSYNEVGMKGMMALRRWLPKGLQTLKLGVGGVGDDGVVFLAKWLRAATGLQVLELENNTIGTRGIRVLAQALPPTLKTLQLSLNNFGDNGARALAGKLPSGLETLGLRNTGMADEGVYHLLAQSLPQGLQVLDLRGDGISNMGVEALMARLPSRLQTLGLGGLGIVNSGLHVMAKGLPLGLQTLQLDLSGAWADEALIGQLPPGLRELNLEGIGANSAQLFAKSLPARMHTLYLRLGDQEEEYFLGWMGSVKERLPCPGALLSVFKDSRRERAKLVIKEMLEREAALEDLRQLWPGEWPQAMDMRVLLCGNGCVGKTCLRRSLMGEPQRGNEPRTMGVEVADIEAADGLRFSIWDFGGQEEFHLLHSYLMPDTSYAAGKSSAFVLVLKLNHGISVEDSQDQLEFWFRMIASTSGPGQMRHVTTVFNQWEGEEDEHNRLLLESIVGGLKEKYAGRIEVHGTWVCNARAGCEDESIKTFWQAMTEVGKELLSDQRVPNVCLDVIARLPELRRRAREAEGGMPVMTRPDLAEEVVQLLPRDGGVRDWVHRNKDRFLDAVIKYLQDAGQIVYFGGEFGEHRGGGDGREVGWVVVDPSWLGSIVAGGLLGLRLRGVDELRVVKGEVHVAVVKKFFEREMGLEWSMVLRLLKEFNLCYEVQGKSLPMLFVPSLLDAGGQEAFKQWRRHPLHDHDHVLGYCIGPADADGEGGRGGEGLFMLGICFFQRLQTILATTMEPQPLAGGGHDLANDQLTSYFSKSRVAFLLKYDIDRDHMFLLARPMDQGVSNEVLVSLLDSVSSKLIQLAASERKAVQLTRKILHPLCARVATSERLALLRPGGAYTEDSLRDRLEESDEYTVMCLDDWKHDIRVAELLPKPNQLPREDERSTNSKILEWQVSLGRRLAKLLHGLPVLPRLCYLERTRGWKVWSVKARAFFLCEGDGIRDAHGVVGADGLSLRWNTAFAENLKRRVKYGLYFMQAGLIVAAILSPIGPVVLPIAAASTGAAAVQQMAQYSHRPGEWLRDKQCQWRRLWEEHLSEPPEATVEEIRQADWIRDDPVTMRLFTTTVLQEVFGRPDLTIGLQAPEVDRLEKKCGIFPVKLSGTRGSLKAGDVVWVCEACRAELKQFASQE